MKKIKKLVAAAIMTTIILSFAGCSLVKRTEESINGTILAEVNGDEITLGDVNEVLAADIENLKAQYGEDYEEKLDVQTAEALKSTRLQVIDMLAENSMLVQEGKEMGVLPLEESAKDEAVEEEIQRLIEIYGGEEIFQEELAAVGYTEEEYRELIRKDVEIVAVIDEIKKDAEVSDEEVQAYFDENQNSLVKEAGEAKTRHLLFTTEEEAKEISDKIIAGEVTFDDLFTEYSGNKELTLAEDATEEEMALPIAEDLGVVSHSEPGYDPLFLAGLMPLKDGEISAPVQSSFGYHIIEAKEVKDSVLNTFDEVEDDIRNFLLSTAGETLYQEKMVELEEKYEIVKYEDRLN